MFRNCCTTTILILGQLFTFLVLRYLIVLYIVMYVCLSKIDGLLYACCVLKYRVIIVSTNYILNFHCIDTIFLNLAFTYYYEILFS